MRCVQKPYAVEGYGKAMDGTVQQQEALVQARALRARFSSSSTTVSFFL